MKSMSSVGASVTSMFMTLPMPDVMPTSSAFQLLPLRYGHSQLEPGLVPPLFTKPFLLQAPLPWRHLPATASCVEDNTSSANALLSKITFVLVGLFAGTSSWHILMVPTFATIMAWVCFVPPLTSVTETHCQYRLRHQMPCQLHLILDATLCPTFHRPPTLPLILTQPHMSFSVCQLWRTTW